MSFKSLVTLLLLYIVNINYAAEFHFCSKGNHSWDMVLQNSIQSTADRISEKKYQQRLSIDSKEDFEKYRDTVKRRLLEILFDDEAVTVSKKPPLNSPIVGDPIEHETYTIYNIAYESIPGFWVPANLYVPNKVKFPVAGLLCVSDHSGGGKAAPYNQRQGIGFAERGYVALVIDFPDRGELTGGNDHFVNGAQVALTGLWSNYLFIINAIRGIDYLQSRNDIINPELIGITGTSGGGETTAIISAIDDRIKVAVPCCYIEPYNIAIESGYTSCPEYFAPYGITDSLEFSDFMALTVPKPLAPLRAMQDGLFTDKGFNLTVSQGAQFYRIAGVSERFRTLRTNEPHTYSAAMREAAYFWFAKWLGSPKKEELPDWEDRILEPNDVVFTLQDDQMELESASALAANVKSDTSLHKIALRRAKKFDRENHNFSPGTFNPNQAEEIRQRVCKFYRPPSNFEDMKIHRIDSCHDSNTIVKSIVLELDSTVRLPAKLIRPAKKPIKSVLLYLDEDGYDGLAGSGFKDLLNDGVAIFAIDIRGMGKLYPRASEWDKYAWCDISRLLSYGSWSLGTSIPHLQVADTMAAVYYLKQQQETKDLPLFILGKGRAAPIALMASAINDDIKGLIGIESLVSYQDFIEKPSPSYNMMTISYGVLKKFDIPDVLASVADKILMWANSLDSNLKPLNAKEIAQTYQLAYSLTKNPEEIFMIGEEGRILEKVKCRHIEAVNANTEISKDPQR